MSLVNTPVTYSEAIARNYPWWTVSYDAWGGPLDTGFTINEGAVIAEIGPLSTISRVSAAMTLPIPPTGYGSPPVTVPIGIETNAPAYSLIGPVTFGVISSFGTTYFRDGTAGVLPFGPGMGGFFEPPLLQMLIYPRSAVNPSMPKRRMAMVRALFSLAGGGGAETMLGMFPVEGRNEKIVNLAATGTLIATIRVGLVGPVTTAGTIASDVTAGTGTINATTGATFKLRTTEPGQFIGIYYAITGGAGNIQLSLVAEDAP